jgi:DNA mismatch repair protein MutS
MPENPTPMMRQYLAVKRELPPKTLLFFRLGDFFEMFGEDAREASGVLNVALTKRGQMPMCGVPCHAAKGYIEKLVAAGWRVAVCDQVGEVKAGKLVRRELTEIVSAGTLESFGLDDRSPNHMVSVVAGPDGIGLAVCDLSTGGMQVTQVPDEAALTDELARLGPSETLVPGGQAEVFSFLGEVNTLDDFAYDPGQACEVLRSHFGVHSLDGFGCGDMPLALAAAGALLHYVSVQLRRNASHLRSLNPRRHSTHLLLDASTQAHLELVTSKSGREGTLLGTVDRTVTPMGARILREWILMPLKDPDAIRDRQEVIARFLRETASLGALRMDMGDIRDIERSLSRLNGSSGNARDLASLAGSLERIPALTATLGAMTRPPVSPGPQIVPEEGEPLPALLAELALRLDPLPELAARLRAGIADEPPGTIREGGMIRDGFDPGLDDLRAAARDGKAWVARLQEREAARTGIKSLKVRFTSVFGYFIEVTKANLGAVPPDYIRKQTTVGGERFVTAELKEIEGKILGAEERARARETELFHDLRKEALAATDAVQATARAVAALDALSGLAETARVCGYRRPEICGEGILEIREGRHPVLDAAPTGERFVPNDTSLDAEGRRFAIITGPNMAGKSTYLRQVALLVLLAQTGSSIPAASARIGVVDRIFTRVGASDDLAKGQSTFMVEMNETAAILHNATASSLVILDEIGRGTSTFDGLSIAWSVAEYLHDRIGCRALFATHYHEMTDLERSKPGVVNLNVAVREWNEQVIFLRKIVPGRADQSYGIQVARLAGLPEEVLARAKEILANLERSELSAEGEAAFAKTRRKKAASRPPGDQLELL